MQNAESEIAQFGKLIGEMEVKLANSDSAGC